MTPLLRLLAPVRVPLLVAAALQAVAAVASIVPFVCVVEIARRLLAPPADEAAVRALVAVAVVAFGVRLLAQGASGQITHLADNTFQLAVRRRVAARLGRLPLGWFGARHSGEVKRAVQDDVAAMHYMVAHSLPDLVAGVVAPLAALAYLVSIDWRLTLITLAPVLVFAALYLAIVRGYSAQMAGHAAALGRVNAAVVELVQGIAVVKAFGAAGRPHERYIQRDGGLRRLPRGVGAPDRAPLGAGGARLLAAGDAADGPRGRDRARRVGRDGARRRRPLRPARPRPDGAAADARLQRAGLSPRDRRRRPRDGAARACPSCRSRPPAARRRASASSCDDVAFSYDGRSDVLAEVSAELEPGTVTALVGASGAGKSTLAALVPRFWDVSAGAVSVGGVDVRDVPSAELYAHVAFVFQDPGLLRASVRDNIRLARPDADDGAVQAAARAAQIHARVLELPRGYDSVIGDDARLSGGEAQRVAIARALLADRPILVLDEATAFADPESEAAIQDALSRLASGRTLVVIAHRLSTIAGADRILVLSAGRVVERGRHAELLDAGGEYARLWRAHERRSVIRALQRLLDPAGRRLLRAQVAAIAAYSVLQGVAFVLLVPILGALLEDDPAGGWLAAARRRRAARRRSRSWRRRCSPTGSAPRSRGPCTAASATTLAALPLGWFGPERVGELGRLSSQGVTDVMGAAAHLLRPMVAAMLTPATVVLAMYLVDWRLALATTLTIPLIYGAHRLASRLAQGAAGAVQSAAAEASGRIVEFARAQPILRAYGRAGEDHRLLDDALLAQHAARRRQLWTMSGGLLASSLAIQLAFLVVTVYGVDRALGGSIDVPELFAVLVLVARFGQPLVEAADIVGALRIARASLRGVERVLSASPLPEPVAPRRPDGAAVRLRGVRFSYGDQHRARRHRPRRRGGHDARARRPVGRRQDDRRAARRALLGRRRRQRRDRRRRRARDVDRDADGARRARLPGRLPVRRHDRGERPRRPAGGERRRGPDRRAPRARRRDRAAAARRLGRRASARAAPRCRAASASASRSPARC